MIEKLALFRIAFCSALVLSNAASGRWSQMPAALLSLVAFLDAIDSLSISAPRACAWCELPRISPCVYVRPYGIAQTMATCGSPVRELFAPNQGLVRQNAGLPKGKRYS